jgi:hypothetical protein
MQGKLVEKLPPRRLDPERDESREFSATIVVHLDAEWTGDAGFITG